MDLFTTLFGVKPSKIKSTCILAPFLTREILDGFGIAKLHKGALYSVGDNGSFNLVYTGMGSAFLGDAVLHLADSPCENLVLFGSCGAVKETRFLRRGSIVIVKEALLQDSFTDMLFNRKIKDVFYPDKNLLAKFSSFGLQKVNCLTVGSLKLEERYLKYIKGNSVDIVDMESGAFFAAAKSLRKKAVSLLFITDILKTFPYYIAFNKENRQDLKNITSEASRVVCEFIKRI